MFEITNLFVPEQNIYYMIQVYIKMFEKKMKTNVGTCYNVFLTRDDYMCQFILKAV